MNITSFLKSRLIFILFYCFWIFVNKLFTYLTWKCFNVKFSTYFHKKTKIVADFQICISAPLIKGFYSISGFYNERNENNCQGLPNVLEDSPSFHFNFKQFVKILLRCWCKGMGVSKESITLMNLVSQYQLKYKVVIWK